MIEMACQTCGEKVGVESFLAAAQHPCGRCGQLLMGQLAQSPRGVRPPAFAIPPAPTVPYEYQPGGSAGLWLGALIGVCAGLTLVVTVAHLGPMIPVSPRGALLGALTGVILSPFVAVSGFISMLILPFSLEGMLGDGMWTRLARGLRERRFAPLILPLLMYVGVPMALCGFVGARMKVVDVLLLPAGLGAIMLGAILGAACGALVGRALVGHARQTERDVAACGIDDALFRSRD